MNIVEHSEHSSIMNVIFKSFTALLISYFQVLIGSSLSSIIFIIEVIGLDRIGCLVVRAGLVALALEYLRLRSITFEAWKQLQLVHPPFGDLFKA